MTIIRYIVIMLILLGPAPALWAQDPPPSPPQTEKEILEALQYEDGKVFEINGKKYIWQDGLPYEVDDQGHKWLISAPSSDDLYEVRGGRKWLSKDAEGTIYLNIAPKTWATIYFDFNSAKIKKESWPVLDEFGKALTSKALIKARLIIAGHTDDVGSEEYNRKLSEERAVAVADYLINFHGLDENRLILQGYGEIKPISTNETEEGRAINRRVEFILLN